MDDKTFEKIHKLFCKSYNIDEECAWRPTQKPYDALRRKVRQILNEK